MSKLVSGNKPTANTVTKPDATPAVKKFPGSGKEIPQGSKVTQTTSTNDKGQKVTTTSATRSGSEVPLDVRNKVRQRRGLPPIESGNTSSSSTNKGIPTKDTEFATDKLLNKNRTDGKNYTKDDAKRMENSFKASQSKEAEFDMDEFDNVPLVNSKGKKVNKIPGLNKMPTGGSNTQMNKDMAAF